MFRDRRDAEAERLGEPPRGAQIGNEMRDVIEVELSRGRFLALGDITA
jgi:hypothetical protein